MNPLMNVIGNNANFGNFIDIFRHSKIDRK